jgi:hypothetical protein
LLAITAFFIKTATSSSFARNVYFHHTTFLQCIYSQNGNQELASRLGKSRCGHYRG